MAHDWKMTITIDADSFEHLKDAALEILRGVTMAASLHQLPQGASRADLNGNISNSYLVYSTSDEARIKDLRREADDLERKLGGPKP